MKQQKALFIKEFKVMSRLYAVPLILMVGLIIIDCIYSFTKLEFEHIHKIGYILWFNGDLIFMLPRLLVGALFVYALSVEHKTGCVYQSMFIPGHRYETVSYKYLVAVLYALVFSFGATVEYYLKTRESSMVHDYDLSRIGFESLQFLHHFSYTFLLLSIACLIWGVVKAVKKLPIFIGGSSLFIIIQFMVWFRVKLAPLFGVVKTDKTIGGSYYYMIFYYKMRFFNNMYYLGIGLIFATVGLYLYNKFSEV